jgi:hypothetical protein
VKVEATAEVAPSVQGDAILPEALIEQLSREIGRLVAEVTTLRLVLDKVTAERDALRRHSMSEMSALRQSLAHKPTSDGPADSPLA